MRSEGCREGGKYQVLDHGDRGLFVIGTGCFNVKLQFLFSAQYWRHTRQFLLQQGMGTELYSYSYNVDPHFLFKQRQFNTGMLFIEGRDILHFADFLGVQAAQPISIIMDISVHNQEMLITSEMYQFGVNSLLQKKSLIIK